MAFQHSTNIPINTYFNESKLIQISKNIFFISSFIIMFDEIINLKIIYKDKQKQNEKNNHANEKRKKTETWLSGDAWQVANLIFT